MNIVHFLYDSPENPWLGGGGAIRAQEINQRLVAKGHEVHMICGGFPGFSHRNWMQNGVHWHSCHFWGNYALSRLLFSLLCRRRFRQLQQQVDVELVVEDASPFSFIMSWTILSLPRVTIFQNWMNKQLFRKMGFPGYIFSWWERYTAKKAQRIIAVSGHLKEQLKPFISDIPCDVVYNGISDDCFLMNEFKQEKCHSSLQLLYLGRIDIYQKGLDLLLDAFAIVLRKNPKAKLQIAGAGKDLHSLQAMVQKQSWNQSVEFLGKGGGGRFAWIQNADIIVMPSRFEGWGIVAMEAQALGKPVVATRIHGLSEAVKHLETGLLCEANAQSIAEGILTLVELPELIDEMGKNGIHHARTFRWDLISSAQELVYTQMWKK